MLKDPTTLASTCSNREESASAWAGQHPGCATGKPVVSPGVSPQGHAILRPQHLFLLATDSPFVANVELPWPCLAARVVGLSLVLLVPERLPAIVTTDFRSLSILAQVADAPRRAPEDASVPSGRRLLSGSEGR